MSSKLKMILDEEKGEAVKSILTKIPPEIYISNTYINSICIKKCFNFMHVNDLALCQRGAKPSNI